MSLKVDFDMQIDDNNEIKGFTVEPVGRGPINYNDLENKPAINGITLVGNKSLSDLGTASEGSVAAKYTKPPTGIPASDLAGAVQTSLEKANTALQAAPVTSVNGLTGDVVLTPEDIGAAGAEDVQAAQDTADDALEVAGKAVRYDQAQTLTDAQKAQARENIGSLVADWGSENEGKALVVREDGSVATGDAGISDAVKTSLLNLVRHVAYIDDQGQSYYDALYAALYASEYPRITAVYAPGSHVVYTDDALDTLKPYLTVTYYETAQSSGTAVAANDYTLTGTLVDGESTVVVGYDDMVTTVQVEAEDFYNQYSWALSGNAITLVNGGTSLGTKSGTKITDTSPGTPYITNMQSQIPIRRAVTVQRGIIPYIDYVADEESIYYPIPVPDEAISAKVYATPATIQWNGRIGEYSNGQLNVVVKSEGWVDSGTSIQFGAGNKRFFILALRADSNNSRFSAEPTEVIVEYSKE